MVTMLPAKGLTVAADGLDELHVTSVVISKLVPSEYTPVAVNCWVNPTCILESAGATDMKDRVSGVTVRAVFPDLPPKVAVMVGVPAPTAVARPLLLIDANDVSDEVHMTCAVIS